MARLYILKNLGTLHEASVQRWQPTCALQFKVRYTYGKAAVSVGPWVRNPQTDAELRRVSPDTAALPYVSTNCSMVEPVAGVQGW